MRRSRHRHSYSDAATDPSLAPAMDFSTMVAPAPPTPTQSSNKVMWAFIFILVVALAVLIIVNATKGETTTIKPIETPEPPMGGGTKVGIVAGGFVGAGIIGAIVYWKFFKK